jgi:cytochrome c biogenesis protein CcmG, thiol:disulfide interchange protein DsbE
MTWRRALVTLAPLAAVVAIVIAEVLSPAKRPSSARRAAPELPRTILAGAAVTLGTLRGKPAIVNFWASWCAPCRREAPSLATFSRTVEGRARVVGVDWADDPGQARTFVRRFGWTYTNLRDASGAVGNRYGIEGLPTTFILDSEGRIAATLRGPQTPASLTRSLASVQGSQSQATR